MNAESQLVLAESTQKRDRAALPTAVDPNATPMQMLAIMTQRGVSMADLKDLVALAKDWESNQARKAYVEAMAAFKAEPIEILKTKDVSIPGGAKFKHATLADVVDGVAAQLSKHGLSHNWIVETGDIIKVTCVVTHKLGHSEKCEMSAPPDNGPGRNKIQAVGSTTTYLQRYSLMSLLGLAAKDMDNDGALAGKKREPEPEGFGEWADNMETIVDEGLEKLTAAWGKASGAYRRYVIKFEEDWWLKLKKRAEKAKVSS